MASRIAGPQPSEIRPVVSLEEHIHQHCEMCGLWQENPLGCLQSLANGMSKSLQSHNIERTAELWTTSAELGCSLYGLVKKLCQDINHHQNLKPNLVQFLANERHDDFP